MRRALGFAAVALVNHFAWRLDLLLGPKITSSGIVVRNEGYSDQVTTIWGKLFPCLLQQQFLRGEDLRLLSLWDRLFKTGESGFCPQLFV
jgi:hypothetical protein